MEGDDVELTVIAPRATLADQYISTNEVPTVLVPFSDELLQMISGHAVPRSERSSSSRWVSFKRRHVAARTGHLRRLSASYPALVSGYVSASSRRTVRCP